MLSHFTTSPRGAAGRAGGRADRIATGLMSIWLPLEDSNLGSRIQSPLSYQLDEGAAAVSSQPVDALPGQEMERKTGLEPATLTLAR